MIPHRKVSNMCFSASASFIAGTSLSAIGVATIKKTVRKSEIPFALIPILFGIQQMIEGVIWLTFRFDVPLLNTAMTYIYVIFAQVFWPVYVPFAVLLLEPVSWRKRMILFCQWVGIGIGLCFLYRIAMFPVTSQVQQHMIYFSPNFHFSWSIVFYFLAACGSCMFSSHKMINILGISTLVFAFAAYLIDAAAFRSIWCFFAAILSVLVYLYFRFRPVDWISRLKK